MLRFQSLQWVSVLSLVAFSAGCSGDDDKGGAATCSDALVSVAADDSKIQYSGRFDVTDSKKPVASASGVTVTAKFRGTKLKVLLQDQFLWNSATNVNQGYYDVIVDGQAPIKLAPEKGVTSYDVPVELACGEHTVTLIKRTEASIGNFTFLGFEVEELLEPPAKPERRILVIGDSITCGSGTDAQDGTAECKSDDSKGYWGQPYESATQAWGTIVAKEVNAERHTVCVGGIGLVRNYSDRWDARTLPDVYDLTFTESAAMTTTPMWDPTRFVPDAILIALGTNDFGPGEGGAENPREAMTPEAFAAGHIAFVDRLKSYYPSAQVFLISSPLLGDGWPLPTSRLRGDQIAAHEQVVEHYAGSNGGAVKAINVIQQYPVHGCSSHPDAAEQEKMATRDVLPAFRQAMGW